MLRRRSHGLAISAESCLFHQWSRTYKHRKIYLSRHYTSDNVSPPSHDIAILGGGISGLASAYYLTNRFPNARLTIYEASDRLGGWMSSKRVPVDNGSVVFEAGPRSLRPDKNGVLAVQLLQELDLAKDTIFTQRTAPAARNRYVYYPDHLVRMPHPSFGIPNILWSLLTEPIFKTVPWGMLTEFSKQARDPSIQDESIGDFFSRRVSKGMVDQLLSAVIHGIYAGDVWKLSAKSLFPGPWRDEAKAGSVVMGMIRARADGVEMLKRDVEFMEEMQDFEWDPRLKATAKGNSVFTFRDGLGMLTDKLAVRLLETGQVEFRTGSPVQSITPAEHNRGIRVKAEGVDEAQTYTHVVSTLSPEHLNTTARAESDSPNARLVPAIPTVTVMTINLYFKTPNMHEPGFGYLIPQATPFEKNPERALGVVFDTAYSPSPADLDMSAWDNFSAEQLLKAREGEQLVNINDFSWYNIPGKPNHQDHVETRGTKVTVMLGGHWWDGWPAYPDEKEGLAMAKSLLERHLGIKEEPLAWQVNLEKNCIPQYTVGHEQRLKQAHNNIWREYKGKLRVAGNWISGVGINDCLRSAYDVAKHFGRDATGLEHIGESTVRVNLKPVDSASRTTDE